MVVEETSVQAPSVERQQEDIDHLIDWMSKEAHLPKVDDREWLLTVLHHNKYSLEKTKNKLENYFSYRNKYPEVLQNRDPSDKDIAQARLAFNTSSADRLTKDGGRVLFCRFSPDASIFDIQNYLKYGAMVCDLSYLEHDRHEYCMSVTDLKDYTYMHFMKALPGIKTGVDIFFGALSFRLRAIHVINCAPGLEKFLNVFKGFLPAKFAERFYVHSSTEELLKYVDEDVVCSDFGGKGPSLADYDKYTAELLEKHRKWFLEQDNMLVDDTLRRKGQKQVEEMTGSFRKLDVD
ncbi:unnamed protein product [Bemisia tabaci]|uniref:CRAL-TRIO domain-containing protein n=1 Tax=Bemisia tabaci TaxID=7038 RepID=A0A9P0AKX0_BEMTA|nr:unnamed protein product [Bemisia tabaci]